MCTYYKYLSFGPKKEEIKDHVQDVFRKHQLYMGQYNGLNDPMEAVYQLPHAYDRKYINKIRDEKSQLAIGCLSKTFTDILMWSHYADGHKGCCIEVEINDGCQPHEITYLPSIYKLDNPPMNIMEACKEILSHKLSTWNYEDEIRFFKTTTNQKDAFLKVNIKKVWLGCALNASEVAQRKAQLIALGVNAHLIKQLDKHQLTFKVGARRTSIFSNS